MPRKVYPSDEMPRISSMRIPADLKDWIKKKAVEENRSQNGQVIHLLQQAKMEDMESVSK